MRLYLAVVFVWMLGACTQEQTPSGRVAGSGDANRGRQIYFAQCAVCHNVEPVKDGPIGPAIKGSPQALLEAKVLRASYPPGYAPKRNTSLMPAQPHLEPDIPDLAAFLS